MATAHSQFGEESQETRAEMANETSTQTHHVEDVEIQEWLESLDSVLEASGPDVAREILERLRAHATVNGIDLPFTANTPYTNTIPLRLEPLFPGDQELERRMEARRLEEENETALKPFRRGWCLGSEEFKQKMLHLMEGSLGENHLFSRTRSARNVRTGVHGRAVEQGEAGEFPARVEAGRRAVFLSASVADAGLLGISDRFDGPEPADGDLSGAIPALSGKSGNEASDGREGVGVPRRR